MGAVLVEAAVGALGVELSEGGSDVVAVGAEGGEGAWCWLWRAWAKREEGPSEE